MQEPYVIRLRGPWEFQPLERVVREVEGAYRSDSEDLPPGGRAQVPGDWGETLGAAFRGVVRYVRRFHRPTNLAPVDRVWLVFDAVDYQATVTLNDEPLGSLQGYQAAGRFDVTSLLRTYNHLQVDVCLPLDAYNDPHARPGRAGAPEGLIGEVRLEIVAG